MFNFSKRQKNKLAKGFTLLETLVTIAIISVGVLGAINLINNSFSSATTAKNRLIAANLAQEGLELVRNVRDYNYLNNEIDWLQGLDNDCFTLTGCSIDSNDEQRPQTSSASDTDGQICHDPGSKYFSVHCAPNNTLAVDFKRIVFITEENSNARAKVISKVWWKEKGVWKDSGDNFEYYLCDWKNNPTNSSCF